MQFEKNMSKIRDKKPITFTIMKKIIIAAVFLLLGLMPLFAHARSPISFRTGVYGGFNMTEDRPLAGAFFSAIACNIIVDIDVGWTYLNHPRQDFVYYNPSAGFYYGDKLRFFGLFGITNWSGIDYRTNEFKSSHIMWKCKIGLDYALSRHLFVTAMWSYIVNDNSNRYQSLEHNALSVGMGFKF